MSKFLEALRAGPLLADGAVGSYLFERTGRLSEKNHVYEVLNVVDPDAICEVHFAYLQAGARCLTTNTFGANRSQLDAMGESGRAEELNRAGVQLAHAAIESFREQTGSEQSYFVLGSIGPLGDETSPGTTVRDVYREQIEALIDTGADALQAETFSSLEHLEILLGLIESIADAPPVIVQMAVRERAGGGWNLDPVEIVKSASALGASVVGVNCCAPWEATAFIEAVAGLDRVEAGELLLSAMPNAGGFHRIGHRYMTHVNPEFMGKLARTLVGLGVRLVGGCCEVHPEHIGEMNNYLHGRQGGRRVIEVVRGAASTPASHAEKLGNGRFSRKVLSGEFAVSVEMLPARGTAPKVLADKIAFIEELANSGLADALDVTDGSRGIPLMPPGDFITAARDALGWTPRSGDALEFVPHFTTRDLNTMGLQSRLMGYFW